MGDAPTTAVLASAGADSTLAAVLLDPFYDVTLVHGTFGIESTTTPVETAAEALGVGVETVALDRAVAGEAVDRMVADGYPREGIQRVHEHALETVADRGTVAGRDLSGVADGTRRDDRAPVVDRSFAQSLEDRHGVDYLRPLAGYGRSAVDDLVERTLAVERRPSETLPTGDYEAELRALMADRYGPEAVAEVFPEHVQSRVVGRR
jgi:predicted subunit of tRNA(5-methylaminomethyl-2-thiouridylate) methyltransferase